MGELLHAARKGSTAEVAGLDREWMPMACPSQHLPELVELDLEEVVEVEVHPIEEQQGHVQRQAGKPEDAHPGEQEPGSVRQLKPPLLQT